MLLRTKIFRHLILLALIPSLIIAAAAYVLLRQTVDQTGSWLSASSPERTINSLRMIESRLQQTAQAHLAGMPEPAAADSVLDWRLVVDEEGAVALSVTGEMPAAVDSAIRRMPRTPGPIRMIVGGDLVIGYALERPEGTVGGGFILDREYIEGFEAVTASLKESRGFYNILPGFILFILATEGIVLAVVVIVAYWLSRRLSASVTMPLERLTARTAGMIKGERPEPISITGTDEVVALAGTFNRMLVDLEDSRRRLLAAERVAAWQGFARRMAHELKNPLTPISLSLYRIKSALEKSGDYERFAEPLEAITAEVAHLERMATDYASLAHLPEARRRRFTFNGLVTEVIGLYRAQLDDFAFTSTMPETEITVEGDPDRLREVMVNLIKNALEFTAPGGDIGLVVEADRRQVTFQVINASHDVNPSDLRSAKMPYFTTRPGGSGLGLAIAEKIIIDHGGGLLLDVCDGRTTASFTIPLTAGATGGREGDETTEGES